MLTKVQVQRIEIPEALLTCAPAPGMRPVQTQKDIAILGGELWDAGEDCRAKLAAIRKLQEDLKQ